MVPEIDFVVSGVLTAVAGKYYTMWRVAPTLDDGSAASATNKEKKDQPDNQTRLGNMIVPTNAFQKTLSDVVTRPRIQQRLGSFIAPMLPLFRAGIIAGTIGYGVTAIMISLRTIYLPNYVPATQNMNVLHACLFTGGFMAIVSNVRYQVLQGIVEPSIDRLFRNIPSLRGILILACRWANGLLGSILAISGMRALGLQRLK
ncbi:Protein RETICULATA-RELATED [Seminavis robusta]|uniref:Protein RETICULATA-RELATED n=1 Tax=Seminavis robusta TaxID=568900 RepID=A0A9N8F3K4_9STRA|nr:Protein RETICULATA-RELATED [Seminavis robusta]|eukprot:Sro3488_g348550.1 Protein RETICULATA-RELATED (202) ;mRNA; r:5797-6402